MEQNRQVFGQTADLSLEELRSRIQESGIVGAGGAGFPTYGKIDARAKTLLLNCAECEPLLTLHRQLLQRHTREILEAFCLLGRVLGATELIIGIKEEYESTIEAIEAVGGSYPQVRLHKLPGVYPMGDEIVLIYEATGRVISPGGLPIEAGVVVMNVETVYNIYRAIYLSQPVTSKLVTIVGEVAKPKTISAPVGMRISEAVEMAGGAKRDGVAYLVGGPMMGSIKKGHDPITKTTNAILVLPEEHLLIQMIRQPSSISMKRAASSCCHCHACTDLCPRFNLGHPIEPHRFMRAMSNHDYQDVETFENLFFCCGCGICELVACPQSLAPRSLINDCKKQLRAMGMKPPKDREAAPITEAREYRKLPEKRLEAKLDLVRYAQDSPLDEALCRVEEVVLPLSQHIGAPAEAVVSVGDRVSVGAVVARAAEGLSVPIHSSIDGQVLELGASFIRIGRPL